MMPVNGGGGGGGGSDLVLAEGMEDRFGDVISASAYVLKCFAVDRTLDVDISLSIFCFLYYLRSGASISENYW